MQFLADENFPLRSVYRLRETGHDVRAVAEDSPGAKDREILLCAAQERRVVLTFDRDYGELIYRWRLPLPKGVIYFRLTPTTPEGPAERLLELLATEGLSVAGKFTVVENLQVRQRPLP